MPWKEWYRDRRTCVKYRAKLVKFQCGVQVSVGQKVGRTGDVHCFFCPCQIYLCTHVLFISGTKTIIFNIRLGASGPTMSKVFRSFKEIDAARKETWDSRTFAKYCARASRIPWKAVGLRCLSVVRPNVSHDGQHPPLPLFLLFKQE